MTHIDPADRHQTPSIGQEAPKAYIPFVKRLVIDASVDHNEKPPQDYPGFGNTYFGNGYHLAPTEDAPGLKSFNSMVVGCDIGDFTHGNSEALVHLNIRPTRYLIGRAFQDYVALENLNMARCEALSPNILNISLLAVVEHNGEFCLVSQIKGKAVGSGQVHASLAAGAVTEADLQHSNPLAIALRREAMRDVAIQTPDDASFHFMLNEVPLGSVNFGSVMHRPSLGDILDTYGSYISGKFPTDSADSNPEKFKQVVENLSVKGLCLLPLNTLQNCGDHIENATFFRPDPAGLVMESGTFGIRPYTKAVSEYLQANGADALLQAAGW